MDIGNFTEDLEIDQCCALLVMFGVYESGYKYDQREIQEANELLTNPEEERESYESYLILKTMLSEKIKKSYKTLSKNDIKELAITLYKNLKNISFEIIKNTILSSYNKTSLKTDNNYIKSIEYKEEKKFPQEVWETLSAIDINNYIEKRNGLNYLSWPWAWGVLMTYYPESYYVFEPMHYLKDGSVMVFVTMTVKRGDKELSHTMCYPVINKYNRATSNPNSLEMDKANMRCLSKAISMFGLGFRFYAGEDLPEQEEEIDRYEIY